MSEIEILKKIPAFSSFDKEIFDLICKTGKEYSFKAGEQILITDNENRSSLLIVNTGKLRVVLTGYDKSQVLLTYLNSGDYWGEFGLFDGKNLRTQIFAKEDSEIIIFSREKLLAELTNNSENIIKLITQLISKLRVSHFDLDSLLVKDSDTKIARTILKLGIDLGVVKSGVLEIVNMPIQKDLAKMASTSRETLSRTLQSFAKKGLIEIEGTALRIKDFIKLRELLN